MRLEKNKEVKIDMLIIWYADFDGTEEDLEKVTVLLRESMDEMGGRVEGPYFPQNEALMYLFKVKKFEQLNQSGRIFLKKVDEEGINITPVRYEVAVTPEEFWEK
jgi:hypothetical protein